MKKKFKKIVKYNFDEDLSIIIIWPCIIFLAVTFPLWYWWSVRDVHWEEIKQ